MKGGSILQMQLFSSKRFYMYIEDKRPALGCAVNQAHWLLKREKKQHTMFQRGSGVIYNLDLYYNQIPPKH